MECRPAPKHGTLGNVPVQRADLMALWDANTWTVATASLSTGSSFASPAHWQDAPLMYWDVSTRWASGDFDGDGDADLLGIWNQSGFNTFTVRRSTGAALSAPETWASTTGGYMDATEWLPGDFDGDGDDDIAAVWNNGGTIVATVYPSNMAYAGGGVFRREFGYPVNWYAGLAGYPTQGVKWVSGDFDRDGRADIAFVWNDGGASTISMLKSTGTGFAFQHWSIRVGGYAESTKWLPADVNGDGRSDMVAVWQNGSSVGLMVYPSNGSVFTWPSHWSLSAGGWMAQTKWTYGDFNGDGKDDLVAVWPYGGSNVLTVYPSSGSSFGMAHWATQQGGWMDGNQWCAGRFQ